ncbi:hypothetical protein Nhal_0368 [Nitrosococcus halophilus Nc 4]|uniref:Uncharacterized protein n=1 Tax=Nitrosococcus halophilus (strain Nc4) TaxID=472759 RepID=D5BVD4_NITHN|nr:hypothetical protein [Nitrosococcus halophilus]ADE13562.1 hypothetical protein Nhal_0368 [Nitrosococcus halophilus Nc 4]
MWGQDNQLQIKYRLCWRDRKSCEYGYSAWMDDPKRAWEALLRAPTSWDRMYWLETRRILY